MHSLRTPPAAFVWRLAQLSATIGALVRLPLALSAEPSVAMLLLESWAMTVAKALFEVSHGAMLADVLRRSGLWGA